MGNFVTKSRLDGSQFVDPSANQKKPECVRVGRFASWSAADPPSMGVPLGWLFSRKNTTTLRIIYGIVVVQL